MDNVSDWPISAFKHNDISIYDPFIKWFYRGLFHDEPTSDEDLFFRCFVTESL